MLLLYYECSELTLYSDGHIQSFVCFICVIVYQCTVKFAGVEGDVPWNDQCIVHTPRPAVGHLVAK